MIDLNASGSGLDGYDLLAAQVQALFADERDFIANAAQFSAFLYHQIEDLNWAGFYLNRDEQLVLGPFQARWPAYASPSARVCAERPRHRVRPSGSRMCMSSQATSPVTAHPIASW